MLRNLKEKNLNRMIRYYQKVMNTKKNYHL